MTSYGEQAIKDQNSPDKSTALGGYIAGGVAPEVAGTNLTVAELLGQIGLQGPEQQAATANEQLQETQAGAGAYLGQEQLGLQAQGLGAQAGLLNTQYGIQQQTLQGQEQLAGTQNTLAQQSLQAQQAQQNLSYGNQQKATQGQIATSGVVGGQGAQNQVATQATENQLANQGIQRSEIGQAAQYGFQQQQFGLQQQGEAAQQAYSLGNIARGETGLGYTAQQNDLSYQQTLDQMKYGLQQAGVASQQQTGNLEGQLGQAISQGDQYTLGAIGSASLLNGGINTNAMIAQAMREASG